MNPLFSVRDLSVGVGERTLCKAVNFSLDAGESLAILGRNGAGKSTLLTTLAGLRVPQAGQIELHGTPLPAVPPLQLARLRGYCPQQQEDAFASTVMETALIGRHPHLGRWDWESATDHEIARDALAAVGLADFTDREVHSLSGGERQRLALAALLVQSPALYLLDEPLTHLDLNHALAMLGLFTRRAAEGGGGLVAVLHDPNLARRYFTHALLLFDDGVWLHGAAHDVLTRDNLSRLYGHPLRTLMADGQPWFIPEETT